MKQLALVVGFILASMTGFAQTADAIKGVWFNPEKDGKVEIYEASGKYYGKLIWIKSPFEADGKTPRKDSKNKDSKLRDRPVLNMVILTGFRFENGKWTDGEIYDPKSGKTYNSVMTLKDCQLEIRGYVGTPLFGKTVIFTRP
ncbi:uncharacterized protein (DUF2147 family) [Chitinophaga dinghuensis]|uniref:Uncharacterized protein (DUF2147 family) n=1 Tax=Chitinophaga dinghuensis TaxID=1539050 RepID=A0A327VTK8_9BACT|nr:DUF2147 domain-containing protein [Chitinophaga dinghuensis]RAJ77288.1 uncharacterized protein (DUF2147 family) [Chitinophaga dinghuensis]